MSSSIWEKRLAEADISAREVRRPFDVAAGLRRLAEDAGYIAPAAKEPDGSLARHRLDAVARLAVTEAGAAAHVEELSAVIGDHGEDGPAPAGFDGWTRDVLDIPGVNVFACTLYLAHHPESAVFWWQLAAGAGHSGAAYCLHLHHLSNGEVRDAALWKHQAATLFKGTEAFFDDVENLTGYAMRIGCRRVMATRRLEEEVDRLAERHHGGGLVSRLDSRLADQIHELAAQH
ncbi:hypothetical protein ACFXPM_30900 [Streptomyces sp. NPDC059095]|uniref:hypothetical protein n=1 Tax=Streptomyces sp. NPDC059095 TaxID=3346726 RepID=UPI0036AC25C7